MKTRSFSVRVHVQLASTSRISIQLAGKQASKHAVKQPGLVFGRKGESKKESKGNGVWMDGKRKTLQNLACALLDLLSSASTSTTSAATTGDTGITTEARFPFAGWGGTVVPVLFFGGNGSMDRKRKDFIHTVHLLAAALHVGCIHSLGHCLALLWCHRSQALSFKKLDACPLAA